MKVQHVWSLVLSAVCLGLVLAPLSAFAADDPKAPAADPKAAPAEAPKTPAAETPKSPPAEAPKTPAADPAKPAEKPAAPAVEKPPADPAKPGEKPAAPAGEKPAAEKPSAEKPAAPGPAAVAFQKKLESWKDIMKKLRSLRKKVDAADENEVPALQQQWNDLITQGNKLVPELRAAAQAAFLEAPNGDREVTRFLVKLVKDDLDHDDYEAAATLSKSMLEKKSEEKELAVLAGSAAFATHDFDAAEKYFNQAKESGAIENLDEAKTKSLADYKKFWKEEQEILAKEKSADDLPRVKIETNKGTIVIELFENEAPQTVGNFINLVEKGFYNGTPFHRVLPGFMAQGGDPTGTGTGGPGYRIYDELKENYRKHFRGYLSMANSGPDTAGSQFFITFLPTPHLNGKHTVFGRVIEGLDVLAKLQRRDPEDREKKVEPDKIVKAEVVRKRPHEYQPVKIKAD